MWRALHAEHEAMDPRYRLSDEASSLWANDFQEWVEDDQHAYLVAQAPDGSLVGLLVAHLMVTTPVYAAELFVHIDDLFVDPAVRGRGVGTRLVEAARAWAGEQRVTTLRVGVLAMNSEGLAFWRRRGGDDMSVSITLSV